LGLGTWDWKLDWGWSWNLRQNASAEGTYGTFYDTYAALGAALWGVQLGVLAVSDSLKGEQALRTGCNTAPTPGATLYCHFRVRL